MTSPTSSRNTALVMQILGVLAATLLIAGCGSQTASVKKLDAPVSGVTADGGSDTSEVDDTDMDDPDMDQGSSTPESIDAVEVFSNVELSGSLLTLPRTGEAIVTDDPAIGETAPVVTSVDFAGNPVTYGNDGPQIRVFLAHWCPHCQAEIPLLVEWMKDGVIPSAVAVRAVSTSVDEVGANYPPSAWLDREGFTGEVMVDSPHGEIAGAHGITGFPFFVAIDGEGKVAARGSGELRKEDIETLLTAISD